MWGTNGCKIVDLKYKGPLVRNSVPLVHDPGVPGWTPNMQSCIHFVRKGFKEKLLR